MKRLVLTSFLLLAFVSTVVYADGVTFNYEGRVKIQGQSYTGTGYFKFAIVNPNGSITHWSNDGTSTTGDEPSAAVVSSVTDGIFNVVIGDTSLTNMAELDPTIFNEGENVFLRVWFSDSGSGFERLRPDRKITNPALLGSQSVTSIDIYVDPDTGNDLYPGTVASRPKKTIQAAWNAIPSVVRSDLTIHLADGIYREEALLTGKMVADATITIVGNTSSPRSVRITGADSGAETTPVRNLGIRVIDQQNLEIEGILIDYVIKDALRIEQYSYVYIHDCILEHAKNGMFVQKAQVTAEDLDVGYGSNYPTDPTEMGVRVDANARVSLASCYLHHFGAGLLVQKSCVVHVGGCEFSDNSQYGCSVAFNSFLGFRYGFMVNTVCDNGLGGIRATYNASVAYPNDFVNYSNNGPEGNIIIESGSVRYH